MGLFEVEVAIANTAAPAQTTRVALLVDIGSTLSWVPRTVLESLGVTPTSRLVFELADGRQVERDAGGVLMSLDGRSLPIPVAFGEAGEAAVLGATALEALGFVVDPVAMKLFPRNLRVL